ncbi:MAG: hypothetical protein AB8F34_14600 [Akkermansiaceae bacterium]
MKKPLLAAVPALIFLTASCDPNAGKKNNEPIAEQAPVAMKAVAGVNSTLSGPREIMRAKVDGKEVMAVLTWRPYDAAKDASVSKWYGDMGTPPPKFVVDSLIISIDGRGTIVPRSKYGYLSSQWQNAAKHLGLVTQGKNLCVYVNVGDGAEAWTASYVINPSTGSLVSHQIQAGAEFHNQIR